MRSNSIFISSRVLQLLQHKQHNILNDNIPTTPTRWGYLIGKNNVSKTAPTSETTIFNAIRAIESPSVELELFSISVSVPGGNCILGLFYSCLDEIENENSSANSYHTLVERFVSSNSFISLRSMLRNTAIFSNENIYFLIQMNKQNNDIGLDQLKDHFKLFHIKMDDLLRGLDAYYSQSTSTTSLSPSLSLTSSSSSSSSYSSSLSLSPSLSSSSSSILNSISFSSFSSFLSVHLATLNYDVISDIESFELNSQRSIYRLSYLASIPYSYSDSSSSLSGFFNSSSYHFHLHLLSKLPSQFAFYFPSFSYLVTETSSDLSIPSAIDILDNKGEMKKKSTKQLREIDKDNPAHMEPNIINVVWMVGEANIQLKKRDHLQYTAAIAQEQGSDISHIPSLISPSPSSQLASSSLFGPQLIVQAGSLSHITFSLDSLYYSNLDDSFEQILSSLLSILYQQALFLHTCFTSSLSYYPMITDSFLTSHSHISFTSYQFDCYPLPHYLTFIYPSIDQKELSQIRQKSHFRFFLPMNKLMIRPINRISKFIRRGATDNVDECFASSSDLSSASSSSLLSSVSSFNPFSSKLLNPDRFVSVGAIEGGVRSLIDGNYYYYHYNQDNIRDDGWGCAYRTLQSICSWYYCQHYSNKTLRDCIPSHKQIQSILVNCGDKSKDFIGSFEWIGAIEVGLVLKYYLHVESRTLFLPDGSDIYTVVRQLSDHFDLNGTPVMIGGGVLAYGLLGIDWNKNTGQVKFLILDPHYNGSDNINNISNIIKGGWVGWKGVDLFLKGHYYNFCLPQRPTEV